MTLIQLIEALKEIQNKAAYGGIDASEIEVILNSGEYSAIKVELTSYERFTDGATVWEVDIY